MERPVSDWESGSILPPLLAACGCFLESEIAETADAVAVEKAYGVFQQEALQQKPDYQTESINTDGCEATQKPGSRSLQALP